MEWVGKHSIMHSYLYVVQFVIYARSEKNFLEILAFLKVS